MTSNTFFYRDRPVFGLDIGYNSLKVMQIDSNGKQQRVSGYGVGTFDHAAVKDGVVIDPESIAKSVKSLFDHNLVGEISTNRVVMSVPAAHTFTRPMTLPAMNQKDLCEAVRLEAEQYIPIPLDDLYIDHEITLENEQNTNVLVVAVPKKIADSRLDLARVLGLEAVGIETNIGAGSRLFIQAEQSDVPTVLIDFGSMSTDITIYDHGLVVTGTALGGGDSFTAAIADALKVSRQEAHIIKTKYGLGVSKKQEQIISATKPILDALIKELRRIIRYYEERSGADEKIDQVVTMGGGANMPGLSDYLTSNLRLAVRMCDPWQRLQFGGLQPPNRVEKSTYITVSGLALTKPRELFA
ncbi:pilus assembly protein PilM [Candidatus Saccharibacteria bacterium]|nr:MAG: pilus assembly protein PilM [Candidatus Saccharibacteria bacterium]